MSMNFRLAGLWLLSLGMGSTALSEAAEAVLSDAELVAHLRERVDRGINRSIVVGVALPGGPRFFAAGTYREGDDRGVDKRTVFEIGDLTQVFTALLAADLAGQKQINLDDPIGNYLPADISAPGTGVPITLEHLATHTSGLPPLPDNYVAALRGDPLSQLTTDTVYEFLDGYLPKTEPGSAFRRSILGVGLLGLLLERETGRSYEELVLDTICKPLEMNFTTVTLSEKQRYRLARGHSGEEQASSINFTALPGSGGMYSTAADLVKLISAHLGWSESPLGSAIEQTREARYPTRNSVTKFSLGWNVTQLEEEEIHWLSGITGGSAAFMAFDEKRGTGVVVLSNSAHSVNDIGFSLIAPDLFPLRKFAEIAELPPNVLQEYVGAYQIGADRAVMITLRQGQLFAQNIGRPLYRIFPARKDQFFFESVKRHLVFVRDEAGKVHQLILKAGKQEITGIKFH